MAPITSNNSTAEDETIPFSVLRFPKKSLIHQANGDQEVVSSPVQQETTEEGPQRAKNPFYGRQKEIQAVLDAYQQVKQRSSSSAPFHSKLLCIKGKSGSGKTSLVYHALGKAVEKDRGLLVSWKAHLRPSLDAGNGFDPAMDDLILYTLAQHEKRDSNEPSKLEWIRQRAKSRLDSTKRKLLFEIKPRLVQLIGNNEHNDKKCNEQSYGEVDENKFIDTSGHANMAFRSLFRVLGSPEQPVILLFDDIHWADLSSLHWASTLIRDPLNAGILFIICYDSSWKQEEGEQDWARTIQGIENDPEVDVMHLDLDRDYNENEQLYKELVEGVMTSQHNNDESLVSSMAETLWETTHGNIEFASALLERFILSLSSSRDDKDKKKIEERFSHLCQEYSDLESLLQERMVGCLSRQEMEFLQVVSCLGYWIATEEEALVCFPNVLEMCQKASQQECRFLVRNHYGQGTYRFASNATQQAAYSLVSTKEERTIVHYNIGRRLWKHYLSHGDDEVVIYNNPDFVHDDATFCVLTQMGMGLEAIQNTEECYAVASLSLEVARIAIRWTSFHSAFACLRVGLTLADNRVFWRDHYDLTLALHNAAAEVAYAIGDYHSVQNHVQLVQDNARVFEDTVQSQSTRIIMVSAAMHKPSDALDAGLKILHRLGEKGLSASPTIPQVVWEYALTRWTLRGKSKDSLVRSSNMMTHEKKVAAMQIMNTMFVLAFQARPLLVPLLAFRMVRLSVRYGLCAISAFGFALYGMFLGSMMGRIDEAYDFGQMSLGVLERFQESSTPWLPRVFALVYGSIYGWTHPLQKTVDPLYRGYHIGMETGDIEFAMWNASMSIVHKFNLGMPLTKLKAMEDRCAEDLATLQKPTGIQMYRSMTFIRESLMTTTDSFQDHEHHGGNVLAMDEDATSFGDDWYLFQRLFVAFLSDDYELAVSFGDRHRSIKYFPSLSINKAQFLLMDCLSRVALFRSKRKNRQLLWTVRKSLKEIKHLSHKAPEFCCNKAFLIRAELESLKKKKKSSLAKEHYQCAIGMSSNNLFERALVCELAGRYYLSLEGDEDDQKDGESLLRKASKLYQQWGAPSKAKRIQREVASSLVVTEHEQTNKGHPHT